MEIEEAKYLKRRAEQDVLDIIKNLSEKTGCSVTSISLTIEQGYAIETDTITSLQIRMELQ